MNTNMINDIKTKAISELISGADSLTDVEIELQLWTLIRFNGYIKSDNTGVTFDIVTIFSDKNSAMYYTSLVSKYLNILTTVTPKKKGNLKVWEIVNNNVDIVTIKELQLISFENTPHFGLAPHLIYRDNESELANLFIAIMISNFNLEVDKKGQFYITIKVPNEHIAGGITSVARRFDIKVTHKSNPASTIITIQNTSNIIKLFDVIGAKEASSMLKEYSID